MSSTTSGASFSGCRGSFVNLPTRSDPTIRNNILKVQLRNEALHSSISNNLNSLAKSVHPSTCSSFSCQVVATEALSETSELVDDRVRRLVCEFRSLCQPIDRVKRLLHYATILAPFDDSARVSENRVTGCTTQVWLDAKVDEFGRMRFTADSDSEISKGFCSCLIWVLDGAAPEEVLKIRAGDLEAMNVGLHGKAQSRVNTWHNVLISMQKKTEAWLCKREH